MNRDIRDITPWHKRLSSLYGDDPWYDDRDMYGTWRALLWMAGWLR